MRARSQYRRGSVYVVVLGASLVVATTALAAMGLARVGLREAALGDDLRGARRAAASGVEYALNWLHAQGSWRSAVASGVEQPPVYLGETMFTWRLTDADGDLTDDERDHAVLSVTGKSGDAYAVEEVDVEPAGERGLSCLEAALVGIDSLTFQSNSRVRGSGFLFTNGDASATSATLELDVDAAGAAGGGNYLAGKYEEVEELETPGEHVFDWYVKRGTPIAIGSIPSMFGTRTLAGRLFSPAHNPFGESNPLGIYVIDCGGQSLTMYGNRVLGTLVLLNAGASTQISDVMLAQPLTPNLPSLMVRGNLRVDLSAFLTNAKTMSEAGLVNFNPPGAAYLGVTDSDTSDTYPACLEGVVYITGELRFTDDAKLDGVAIARDVVVEDNEVLTLTGRRYAYDYPPPGFSAGSGLRALPGTSRRAAR